MRCHWLILLHARRLRRRRPLAADQGLQQATTTALAPYPYLADGLDDRASAGSSSTSFPTAGRWPAPPSSSPAVSTSSTASTGCALQNRAAPDSRGRGAGKKALICPPNRWHKPLLNCLNAMRRSAVGSDRAGTEDQAFDDRRCARRFDGDGFAGAARQPAGGRRDARPHQGTCPRHRLYLQPPRRQPAHLAVGHRRRRRARHHEPVLRRDPALDRKRARPQPPDLHPVQPLRPAREAAHLHRHAAAARRRRRDHVAGHRHAGRGHHAWPRRTACRRC